MGDKENGALGIRGTGNLALMRKTPQLKCVGKKKR